MTAPIANEAQLTKAVGEALRCIPGVMVIRRNVGRRGHQRFGVVGECDYEVIIGPRGRVAGIELKWGKGERSLEQIEWSHRLLQVGAAYLCTDSLLKAVQFVMDLKEAERGEESLRQKGLESSRKRFETKDE